MLPGKWKPIQGLADGVPRRSLFLAREFLFFFFLITHGGPRVETCIDQTLARVHLRGVTFFYWISLANEEKKKTIIKKGARGFWFLTYRHLPAIVQ